VWFGLLPTSPCLRFVVELAKGRVGSDDLNGRLESIYDCGGYNKGRPHQQRMRRGWIQASINRGAKQTLRTHKEFCESSRGGSAERLEYLFPAVKVAFHAVEGFQSRAEHVKGL
jgi:hypothetical protein